MDEAHLATRAQQAAHYSAVRRRLNGSNNAFRAAYVPPEKSPAGTFLLRFEQSVVNPEDLADAMKADITLPPAVPTEVPLFSSDDIGLIIFRIAHGIKRPEVYAERRRIHNAKSIVRMTATEYGLLADDIFGPRRFRPLVEARHKAIWRVCVACPKLSLAQIAELFGNRDHTTVLHAYRRVEESLRSGPFADAVDEFMFWTGATIDEAIDHFRSPPCRLAYQRQAAAFEAA